MIRRVMTAKSEETPPKREGIWKQRLISVRTYCQLVKPLYALGHALDHAWSCLIRIHSFISMSSFINSLHIHNYTSRAINTHKQSITKVSSCQHIHTSKDPYVLTRLRWQLLFSFFFHFHSANYDLRLR